MKLSPGLLCLGCMLRTGSGKKSADKVRGSEWFADRSDQRHQGDFKTGMDQSEGPWSVQLP